MKSQEVKLSKSKENCPKEAQDNELGKAQEPQQSDVTENGRK